MSSRGPSGDDELDAGGGTPGGPAVTQQALDQCSREPIHIPGAIQPHGALLSLAPRDLLVLQASANCAAWLGQPPADLLGRPLGERLPAFAAGLSSALTSHQALFLAELGGRTCACTPYVRADRVLLEVEAHVVPDGPALAATAQVPGWIRAIGEAGAIGETTGPAAACALAATLTHRLTAYDRVMVYRFDDEGNGEVVAEAVNPGIEPFLGHSYPAADIPLQARAMMVAARVRLISASDQQPVPLVPRDDPRDGAPLDLGTCGLRAVSPIHLEYLRNMRVGSSLTAAITHGTRLWGLLACHQLAPRVVPGWQRAQVDALANALAAKLADDERARHLRAELEADRLQRELLSSLTLAADTDWTAEVMQVPRLLTALGADGALLAYHGTIRAAGAAPAAAGHERLLGWLRARLDGGAGAERDVFATDSLRRDLPELSSDGTYDGAACGMLARRLAPGRPDLLVWFRAEQVRTVTWAGDPRKTADAQAAGRLHPRTSFAAWREEVRGRSRRWSIEDLHAAAAIGANLHEVVGRVYAQQRALARANRELGDFAHAAAHDLQEPLNAIASSCGIVRKHLDRFTAAHGDAVPEQVPRFMTIAEDGARRGQELVKDLLDFSRLGAEERPAHPVALAEAWAEAATALRATVQECGATIIVGDLPTVHGHRRQLIQLLQNLLSNALKYRGTAPPRVAIGARRAGLAWEIAVADNGIGIERRHHEEIFVIFRRLHGKGRYPGTGVGLALCRKVVEQHGGRLWVESQPGAGSTFRFTIPDPPPGGVPDAAVAP